MASVRAIVRTIIWSVQRRGIIRTLREMARYAFTGLADPEIDPEFDKTYGTETDGVVLPAEMDVSGPNARFATRYEPTLASDFSRAIEAVDFEPDDFSFVDLGCGKGKVLLMASAYPFQEIVGVEHSPSLCRIAEENIRRYQRVNATSSVVSVHCGDAGTFEFPPGPLFVFMFNPFREQVMRTVLENLGASVAESPRKVYIVYQQPVLEELLAEADFLRKVDARETFCVYTNDP